MRDTLSRTRGKEPMMTDLFTYNDFLMQLQTEHPEILDDEKDAIAAQLSSSVSAGELSRTFFDAYWNEVEELIENWKNFHN